jgi:hypothetical protein
VDPSNPFIVQTEGVFRRLGHILFTSIMNAPVSLSSMFQTVGLVYGWTMPILVLVGIALLFW